MTIYRYEPDGLRVVPVPEPLEFCKHRIIWYVTDNGIGNPYILKREANTEWWGFFPLGQVFIDDAWGLPKKGTFQAETQVGSIKAAANAGRILYACQEIHEFFRECEKIITKGHE